MKMDSVIAIGLGLGLRALLDAVTNDVHKSSALVGIWEGVVLNHFLTKMPKSYDPYVAFGVRLFVDFLFTESLARMTIVVLWAGMGMLFADLWLDLRSDRRFRRIMRRLRRRLSMRVPRALRHNTLSRVRFMEIPNDSTASTVSRSSARSPTSTTTLQLPPPILRRPTRPVPGQFDQWSEVSIPTDVTRDTPTETTDDPVLQRSPSEIEYITLPTIPDNFDQPIHVPAVSTEEQSSSDDGLIHLNSGLTTPTNDPNMRDLPEDDRPYIHSGLTTPEHRPPPSLPPLHTEGLPPVRVIPDELEHTPTRSQLDLPPIPIPPPEGNFFDMHGATAQTLDLPHVSELFPPLPSPGLLPPVSDIPVIPTPEDRPTDMPPNRDSMNISPPPQYEEPIRDVPLEHISDPPSDDESVVTGHSRGSIIVRAEDFRRQAQAQELERDQIKNALKEAERDGQYFEAIKLAVELEEADVQAKQLHAKASRRFYHAHNIQPEPQTIDVHRLSVQEAMIQTKRALRTAYVSGSPELRIITGRGKHSKNKIPVLKLAIVGEMQKHHIEAVPDNKNPGVLVIKLPTSLSEAGPSGII